MICDCTRGDPSQSSIFDDIWVEPKHMFQVCKFFPASGEDGAHWKWAMDGEDMDNEEEGQKDIGNKIRVKFESCDCFTKQQTNLSGEPITVEKGIRATKQESKI